MLLLGLAAAGLMWGGYRRVLRVRDYGPWVPRALLALRLAAVLLFALLIGNPILRLNRAPREGQRIVVLVDTSRSMGVRDSIGGETRLETAKRLLESQGVMSGLEQLALTQLRAFDVARRQDSKDRVRPLAHANEQDVALQTLKAEGEASELYAALESVREEKQKAPLAAIVLLTDGCETGVKSAAELPPGVPLYAVGLGSLHEALVQFPDVALTDVKCDREAFVHTQVEALLELHETHLAGERVTVQILRAGQVLCEDTVELQKEVTHAALKFNVDQPGLYDLEARVLPHALEKITENNGRFFSLRVSGQKIRVFYYEGTPRWTYKFLTRELKRDPQLALHALLRTNTDALYQTSNAPETSGQVFPSTREALKHYDCVILGDLRGSDLSAAQVEALKAYVSDDGGGLILLAGKESYAPGGLPMLGLDALMPASLASSRLLTGSFNVALTQDGSVHPAFGGLQQFLPLESVYTLGEPKPGAQVLARADGEKGSYALAASQRYGNGRVFAFASDSDWKWSMKLKAQEGDNLFGRFWGQIIRWAANRQLAPEQQAALTLSSDKEIYKPGEAVHIYAAGADLGSLKEVAIREPLEKFALAERAENAEKAGTKAQSDLKLAAFSKSGERLEAQFVPLKSGLHQISAGGATAEFLVERPVGEFDRLALNDVLLRQLSASSGGQYFDATTAQKLPETIKLNGHVKTEIHEYVFNDSWLPFALIVLALGAEWVMRKKMQVV